MLKKLFIAILTATAFGGALVLTAPPSHAEEELPIVEVPIQEWAQNPMQVDQIVPSSNADRASELEAPVIVIEERPSVQIDNKPVIVTITPPAEQPETANNGGKKTESAGNRPILQAPNIEIPAPKAEKPSGKKPSGKKDKPVITNARPQVQPQVRGEQITVPDFVPGLPETDFGTAELLDEPEVSQVEVVTPQPPTPNPLWGALGIGLLGAAGSMTILHFVRS